MLKSNLQILHDLTMKVKREKYPNTPEKYLSVKAYSDKTANGLTKCIVDFLNLSGWQAERINIMGKRVDNRRVVTNHGGGQKMIGSVKWIKSNMQPGTADISTTIKGRSVKIEVKIKDRQSPAQKKYQESIERSGGIYIIVRNFDEFITWYNGTMPQL